MKKQFTAKRKTLSEDALIKELYPECIKISKVYWNDTHSNKNKIVQKSV